MGCASEIMRIEIMKKGKLPSADRYKQIMKKKLADDKQKAMGKKTSLWSLPGTIQQARHMSKYAEQALQQIAQKKAKKEAKALRQMVIVQPRNFQNGRLTQKGKIYDIAGNLVGQVNTKNGRMSTMNGWSFGKYKPKSVFTNMAIENAIHVHSPYFINLRKQQLLQQQGVVQYGVHGPASGGDVLNVYGNAPTDPSTYYGADVTGPRQNVGVTAWGARSDNVWGTFSDNVWGKSLDNVWGGMSTDVWGGISVGGLWGQKGPNIWGTGNGHNYLRGVTNFLAALFGLSDKKNRQRLRSLNTAARASSGATTRAAAPAAPVGRR